MTHRLLVAWIIFKYFCAISMMAVGGGVLSLTPQIYRFVVVEHHWLSPQGFVAAFSIAQAAPGPNFLYATLVALQAGGVLAAVGATLALVVPPALLTLVALTLRLDGRTKELMRLLRFSLSHVAVGMMLATAISLVGAADTGWATAALTALTVVAVMRWNVHPLVLIGAGALGGLFLGLHG